MKRILSLVISLALLLSVIGTIPFTVGAASMSDADFFAKFDYAKNPGMAAVKAAVDSGDYTSAKKELINYLSERKANGEASAFPITADDENYGQAVLPLDNILTGPYEFDVWLNRFTVTSKEYTAYEADLTEKVKQELNNQAVSVMLFERQKQAFPVLVASKEYVGLEPVLLVETADGETYEITPDNDTYVNSGATTTTYGEAAELYVKEQSDSLSSPFGSATKRAYINFPLTDAANQTVVKATIKLYAKLASDATVSSLDVHIISVGDTMWDENKLTWATIGGNIYSYQNASVPTWQQPGGADGEYQNVTTRFWFARSMAYEYLTYLENPKAYAESHPLYPDGSVFGEKLIDLMDAFASQKSYGYNRTLETGERLNRWVDVLDALIDTPAVQNNPDKVCNIISFMWGDCNYLAGLDITNGSYWWSNWRIVANAGFFKGNEYFPEFKNYSTWRSKLEGNINYTLDLLFQDDMSFAEAGPAYAVWCVELFGDCARMAKLNGRELDKTFTEKLRYAARFALESIYPDGYDTNIGDSNYRDRMSVFNDLADFYGNDSILNAFVNGTDDNNPEYYSSTYQNANTMMMRNSWNPDEAVYMQLSNNPFDGHAHPDSNSIVMYAYGKPLLVDSGRYSYSSFNTIYNDLRYASAHNTIEAVGVSMEKHSAAAKPLEYAVNTNSFDFGTTSQVGYSGTTHTRNVMYLKNGYSIVTDYVTGSNSREYRQNWHFMPSSNATMNGNTAETDFYNEANITIVSSGSDNAAIRDGFHSADYGLVAASKYASYSKTGSTVTFDTILYPQKPGENKVVTITDRSAGRNSNTAVEITIDNKHSYYYVKNNDSATGVFSGYETDAKMAYVTEDEDFVAIVDGSKISGLIESNDVISAMGLSFDGETLDITGENLIACDDIESAIAINKPDVVRVTLNGEEIPFKTNDGVVYAVRSASYKIIGENLFVGGLSGLTNAADGGALNWAKVTNPDYSVSGEAVHPTSVAGGNASSTMRTFIPIEGGKSYLVKHSIYNNTGSATASHSNAGMSAIVATGDGVFGTFENLTVYSHVEYGGFNSWSAEGDHKGVNYIGSNAARTDYVTQPGLNTVSVIINAPKDATNIMISYGAWGNTELYYGDFEVYEVDTSDLEKTTVTAAFTDSEGNALADSITEEIAEGIIYIYDAPKTIVLNDEYYVLDENSSLLSCKTVKGANEVYAVYNKTGLVTVKHTATDGTKIADDETYLAQIGSAFDGRNYAKTNLVYESKVYNYAENSDDIVVVSSKISENTINLKYTQSEVEFDGKLAHFTFDDEETGFVSTYAKANSAGTNVLSDESMRGKSLQFDGTGANFLSVTNADGEALLTGMEEVTIVFYAKVLGTGANWSVFMAPNANTQSYQNEHYVGMLHNGNLIVERYNNSGSRAPSISVSDPLGEWKKYALVIEEGQTTLYVDGVKTTLASSFKLSDILGNNSILQIGKANWGGGEYFTGYIDELMIYNYALSESEINNIGGASSVTVNYVDANGKTIKESTVTPVLSGVELTENIIPYDKLIEADGTYYVVKSFTGIGEIADGSDMTVTVVYAEAVTGTETFKATKGDSLRSATDSSLTDFKSETGGDYPARLMTDNRWYKRAGVMGFEVNVPDGTVITKATVKLHVNASNGTTGATIYTADTLPEDWSRGNVTGFALPSEPICGGAVNGSYITFDVTDYITENGNVNFAVFTTVDQQYIIYDSENTSYVPELIIETATEKVTKFEVSGDSVVYTSYDGENATVTVAYYNADGEVLKVESNTGNGEQVALAIDKTISNAAYYKAFVWKSANSLEPIMTPIEGKLN